MSGPGSTPRDTLATVMASTAPQTIVSPQNTGSMIDSRNVYKISPMKTTVVAQPPPAPQKQDIVKIRLTKDESGNGFGYTKSIISSAQVPEDKTDTKTTPPKMSINLAQQPTLQLKTSQNKIVLVKMLPKLPQSGPQVVPVATQRSSLSPTTLALARGVQGLRPIPPGGSPPSATVTTLTVTKTPDKPDPPPVKASESSLSLSPETTTTTTQSTSGVSTELDVSSNVSSTDGVEPAVTSPNESMKAKSSETLPSDTDQNGSLSATSVKMSREMRILKASQSSSKILSEFIQDTSSSSEKLRKRRRSRGEGDDSRSCGSLTPNSMKRCSISGRDDDDLDDGKDGSASGGMKRTGMRSANAEFSMKQRKFLNSILSSDSEDEPDHHASGEPAGVPNDANMNAEVRAPTAPKPGWDKFCWRCKATGSGLEPCAGCIRCYHPTCLKLNPTFFVIEKKWHCPECIKQNAPSGEYAGGKDDGGGKPPAKDTLKLDSLMVSLKFAMKRIQQLKGSAILNPLDKEHFPNYEQYVTNHIDLVMLQQNVTSQKYRTTDAFIADVNWILHNASIYPHNNKLLPVAKALVKVCKQEMNEIEACNECYFNANTCKMWFTEVCTKPHLLVWAKLKGFPFWPAKLMSVNSNQLVDVRFFGDHDRAWVPIKECMLFCEKDPNTKQQRRSNMAECMREADIYIGKLKRKFGQFRYSEFRTPVEANKLDEHLEAMIPGVLKKVVENEDSQKTKLMLKIIKTADNFLSVSPISTNPPTTSTPKAAANVASSPEKAKSDEFEEPQMLDHSKPISNKIKNESAPTPEPSEGSTQTRKRKSSVHSDETKAEDDPTLQNSSIRRRSCRVSTAMSKLRDEGSRNSVAEDSLRCSTSKKRREESPTPEAPPDKESKQDKIESVVIQRKSDSWKAVPAAKKQKTNSKSSEDLLAAATNVPQAQAQENAVPETRSSATVVTQKYAIVEKTTPEAIKPKEVPLLPLAPTEIKTEVVDEEPPVETPAPVAPEPVVPEPVVEPPPPPPPAPASPPSNTEPAAATKSPPEPEETPAVVTQQLLPIKLEPVSDDECDDSAAGVGQPVTPHQVLIRTNNRIMVKDITKLTRTTANNQQVVLTPVDKSKNFPPKPIPKVLPTTQLQKVRRVFPSQQQLLAVNPIAPNRPIPTTGNMGAPPRNGSNMMHMVHIPSPLPTASNSSEAASRIETTNGATAGVTVQPVRQQQQQQQQQQPQQPSNCDTAPAPPVETVPSGVTAGPANNVPSAIAGPSSVAPPPVASDVEGQHMMSGFITPSLAAAVTETIVSTPPKLQSRPSGAIRSEGDCVYPSGAGPVSQILINNSYKMADFFRSVIEDTLADLSNNSGALESKVKVLELEIEKLKHCHQQEIAKLKHNSDLVLCEMRKNMDLEKTRIINEVRKQCEIERIRSVEEAKRKQWCVNCGKEALFYCCWNTSYCDYPCQQQHWSIHMSQCTQSQLNLPSTAIASKPTVVHQVSKVATQHITTPKITTVQTLNLNGRSGLTIQPNPHQQQQQQQLIITSARGAAQLGKGQTFQRLR